MRCEAGRHAAAGRWLGRTWIDTWISKPGSKPDPSLTADEAGQLAMLQTALIGLGAGVAAALLYASVASGTALALLLAHLAPLPILIVALGWSHWAGLVAAVCAAAALGIVGFRTSLGFVIGAGAPAWWLGYLALLARPVSNGGVEHLEWYPAGRLLLWCALVGSTMAVISFLVTFGTDWQTFQADLRKVAEEIVRLQAQATRNPGAAARLESGDLIGVLTVAMPIAVAAFATLINTFTLWLAGHIVHISGRLKRPWPDLPAIALPPLAPALLAASLIGAWLPDFAGFIATACAASLVMAYAILGLAVLHAITRGIGGRTLILIAVYLFIILFAGIPLLLFSMLGLADSAFNLRGRAGPRAPPPNPPPT
jgi:hypothetical protein